MPILSKDKIFASTLKTEEVEVPSWGGSVLVGEFSVARRNELLGKLLDENGKSRPITPELFLDLFISGVVEPEFTPEDAAELQKVSGRVIQDVAEAVLRVNGLGDDALDEARGNS